jgi:hypothetical protein
MKQFQAVEALLGDSLPVHILDRGRWAEARMALVLAKQCHLVSQEFLQLHRLRLQWLAQRFDLLKTVKLIVGASRSDGPTIAPLCEGTRFETAVMFWGLWGGCRAMLTQLVPKLSAWEAKEKTLRYVDMDVWACRRVAVVVGQNHVTANQDIRLGPEPRGDNTLKFAATLSPTYRNPHSTGFSNLSTHSKDPITAPSAHHLED